MGTAIDSTPALSKSVKSGMSLEEIARARPDTWQSRGRSARSAQAEASRSEQADSPAGILSQASGRREKTAVCPEWIKPQLAMLVDAVPDGDEWIHEVKYDGYRMLCRIDRGAARLFSRSGKEWTEKLSEQAKAVAELAVDNAWLDGELVALNPDGTTSFQALQNAFDHRRMPHLFTMSSICSSTTAWTSDRIRSANASGNWLHSWRASRKTVRCDTATIFADRAGPCWRRPAERVWKV